MKKHLFVLTLAAFAGLASAQDSVSPEALQKVVPRFIESAGKQEDLPLKMEVSGGKAVGMAVKEFAAVLLPASGLSKESLAKAGSEIVPVGQLWLKILVPSVEGKAVAAEKLREITVMIGQEGQAVQMLMLGLRKKAEAGHELVVFAKGKEPVLTLPLQKVEREQEQPLEIDMRQGSSSFGEIDIKILGQFKATLPVEEAP